MEGPQRHIFNAFVGSHDHSRRAVNWATSQPGWVSRAASIVALVVLSAVVLILVIPALAIGTLVFILLATFTSIRFRLKQWRADREPDGRENVRVIRRD